MRAGSICSAIVALLVVAAATARQPLRDVPTIPRPDFVGEFDGPKRGKVLIRINMESGRPVSARYIVRNVDLFCGENDDRQRMTFNIRKAEFVERRTFERRRHRFGYPNQTRFRGRLLPNGAARGFFSHFNRPPGIPDEHCETAGRLRWSAEPVSAIRTPFHAKRHRALVCATAL